MNLSRIDFKAAKKWIILGALGFVVLFLLITFIASYYKYKTEGAMSEEPVSAYDEESFNRLLLEFTKDKPEKSEQKNLLANLAKQNEQKPQYVALSARAKELYTPEMFDTLAVNCGVLLEKYKELAIKYHELKKKTENKKTATASRKSSPTNPFAARSSGQGFDYTRYLSPGSTNELRNEGSSAGGSTAQFTWATLSLGQNQKVFNQSVVTFDVAEPFLLGTQTIERFTKMEGVAQVSRGRGRVFINFTRIYSGGSTIEIAGEAFSLDKSRGVNVYVHGANSLTQSLKREAGELTGLFDPTRTQIARSVVLDTDVGLESFASLDAGMMVLANIRKR